MQITIRTARFKAQLEDTLEEYDSKYAELVTLYRQKMGEYIVALDKEVSDIVSGKKLYITIYAPNLQANRRNVIVKALKALGMHARDEIELSDNEYNNIVSAIESEVTSLSASYNTLGGTAYGGIINEPRKPY